MRLYSNPGESGATLITTAITLVVLIGAAAIAVDLAALRLDRSADQRVSDSAASAGALAVSEISAGLGSGNPGDEACVAALGYVLANSDEITTIDTTGCADAFSDTCDPGVAESHQVSSGRFSITVTYPVTDGHALMTSGQLGAPSQALVGTDGDPCERVGVQIAADREGTFGQILGFDGGTTTVHAVATAFIPDDTGVPINLLVLDRSGCQAIKVDGNGGIIVDAVISRDGSELIEGIAASDSDGSDGCLTDGVIDLDGANSVIRADGPAGCPNQSGTATVTNPSPPPASFTKGLGCGAIQTLAAGADGISCTPPACTRSGGNITHPNPFPTTLPARLTRQPIDHRFNCWSDYEALPGPPLNPDISWATVALTAANEQEIEPCGGGNISTAHIYRLIGDVGPSGNPYPLTYTRWTDIAPCATATSDPPITVGNVWVNCDSFIVRTSVTVNGNAIFDGHVEVTGSSGHLILNNTAGTPGWAFFRGRSLFSDAVGSNGTLLKSGDASLTFRYTTVYLSRTSRVSMAGGAGSLNWIAPDGNGSDYRLDDMALWSDSPLRHDWAGQANLTMEGIFFMPFATAEYSGTGGQNQTDAQWVAWRLHARGNGALTITPAFGRSQEFDIVPRTRLVR